MRNGINSRSKWLITATVAVAVVAGGLALGSNMGFKFNAQVVAGAGSSPKFDNWIALPDNNPYTKSNQVCSSLGLTSTGANTGRGVVSRLTASSGAFQNYTCGSSTLGAFTVTVGDGIKVRNNVAKSWLASHF